MSLIFGELGSSRIVAIANEMRKLYVKRVTERYSIQGIKYCPWLGLDNFLPKGSIGNLMFENYTKPTIELSPAQLTTLKQLSTFKRTNKLLVDPLEDWTILDGSDQKTVSATGNLFKNAHNILVSSSEYFAILFREIIDIVVPLNDYLDFERGFSNHYTKGAIFLSPRSGYFAEIKLAISMAHEIGHQVLMLYQITDSIILDGQKNIPVYSGVRKTFRPAMQTYHAAIALSFMILACDELANYFDVEDKLNFIKSTKKDCTENLLKTIEDLKKKCEFTPIGTAILNEIQDRLIN